jgi:hypothetical protein
MKRRTLIVFGIAMVLTLVLVTVAQASGQGDLARIRKATAPFQQLEAAQAAGYDLVPGLDHCFDNPGVGGMGYHYINTALLDTTVELLRPEAMVYEPTRKGLRLGAVEYIVPAEAWDAAGNTHPPILMGQHFHLNEALGVYVLHAWVWKNNPAGVFEDWNPRVSCP